MDLSVVNEIQLVNYADDRCVDGRSRAVDRCHSRPTVQCQQHTVTDTGIHRIYSNERRTSSLLRQIQWLDQ